MILGGACFPGALNRIIYFYEEEEEEEEDENAGTKLLCYAWNLFLAWEKYCQHVRDDAQLIILP